MTAGKWTFNYSEDEFWNNELFETKEEAIVAGQDYYGEDHDIEEGDYFFIGQVQIASVSINVQNILETIAENTYDEYGEVAEDYLWDVKREHEDELDEKINKVILDWMEKYNYLPSFYSIKNVEKVYL